MSVDDARELLRGFLIPAVVAIFVASCDFSDAYTIHAVNQSLVVDFVVTLHHGDRIQNFTVRGDGFVYVDSRPPTGATVLVRDPVSCRVLASATPLADHTTLIISYLGDLEVTDEDPRWLYDSADRLPETDRCASASPDDTPTPSLAPVAGRQGSGNGVDCAAARGPARAFATISGLARHIAGCEFLARSDIAIPAGERMAAWNPDDDPLRLGLTWEDTACDPSVGLLLTPVGDGYVVSGGISDAEGGICQLRQRAVLVYLHGPVSAETVTFDVGPP